MENIRRMELASVLSKNPSIMTEKRFLGFKTCFTYRPTHSPLVGIYLEYDPINGHRVRQLVASAPDEVDELIQKEGMPHPSCNGNIRLCLCYSRDHHFAAMQLSQYANFDYHPIDEIRVAEGEEAEKLLYPFVR
ncbi:MAG: hypothetical protein MJZ26_14165 [Fibrobacter sp.]|nr:hypothetical protein [Fibrobacter sp.]